MGASSSLKGLTIYGAVSLVVDWHQVHWSDRSPGTLA